MLHKSNIFYFTLNKRVKMIKFVKESLREFKHVVWPTREETRNYFIVVLAILIFFGLYLFVASNIFSEILFGIKDLVR